MEIDENSHAQLHAQLRVTLVDYAREHLLRTTMAADRERVESFLHSTTFSHIAGGFNKVLEKAMQEFTPQPDSAPAPEVLQPLPVKDLSAPAMPTDVTPPAPAPEAVEPPASLLADVGFRLPNARAGDAYRQPLEAVPVSVDKVCFCGLETGPGLTLDVDKSTGLVTGTPATPGEHVLTVTYHYATEPGQTRHAAVNLTVTPDPKQMWQTLPAPSDAPYPKSDTATAARQDDAFRIVAASKRGRSHAHVGSFRDDDFQIAQVAGAGGANWQIAVLADGAGSAKYSRQGAAIVCEQATARLTAALQGERGAIVDDAVLAFHRDRGADEATAALALRGVLPGVVGNAAYYAAKGIMDECAAVKETLQAVPKDYATTALIAICKRYPFGVLCAAYWVGDGAIGLYSAADGITLLGDVDSGEFSGQTRFLEGSEVAQEALLRRTRFVLAENMTALILMTDGVSDPRFETEARLARPADWHALWSELAPALDDEQALLGWLDFWSPGNHDDRTIAVITPLHAPLDAPHG